MCHFNLTTLKDHWEVNCREMKDFGKRRLVDYSHMKVNTHEAVNREVSMGESVCCHSLSSLLFI
jgi:hypothetical protein